MPKIEVESNDRPRKDEKFLKKAQERFAEAKEYWDRIYGPAREDLEFFAGEQWPGHLKAERSAPGAGQRPTLTINRLPQFHNQIVNDYRQASIGMRAVPQGAEDDDAAKTYQGIFRQVEKHSVAQLAYIKGISDAATHGLGYIRVLTDYADDKSFDQDIFIKRVTNCFAHYPDPTAQGFFLEDAEYWFVVERMKKEDHEGQYDDEELEDFDVDLVDPEWINDDDVIVAEYFYFEYKNKTLLELGNGEVVFKEDYKEDFAALDIKRQRKVQARVLNWAKIDGCRVLDKRELKTKRIPIVPVWGNELWIGEKRQASGFVRNAKDSQRMYNYWQSAKTEMVALAPKAPYVAAEGQLEGHEEEWKSASTTPRAVLVYKATSVDGHLVPAPQRQSYEAPVQAIIQASLQAADDMKATIGIYDASLGARGNETSGIAIERRQKEGDTATFNFTDNLALAIGYVAQIVAELIPITYDTERQLRIIGEDGIMKTVTVNQTDEEGNPVKGSPQIVDVRYDLVLDTGASLATQRQETARILTELSHNYPKLMEVAGDIAIGAMNFTGAREIAQRLKRTIPPEVVGPNEDPVTKLHAAEQQLQQGAAVIEGLTAKVKELELQVTEQKLKLVNKSGEIKVKEDEVAIKRRELMLRAQELQKNDAEGKVTGESIGAVIEAVLALGSQLEALQDMVMAAVAEEDTGDDEPPVAEEMSVDVPTPTQEIEQ